MSIETEYSPYLRCFYGYKDTSASGLPVLYLQSNGLSSLNLLSESTDDNIYPFVKHLKHALVGLRNGAYGTVIVIVLSLTRIKFVKQFFNAITICNQFTR